LFRDVNPVKDLTLPQFFQSLKMEGDDLGEALGKASSANTVFGLSRCFPITGRCLDGCRRLVPLPSKAWPHEALERGLSRAPGKRRENWGWASVEDACNSRTDCRLLVR